MNHHVPMNHVPDIVYAPGALPRILRRTMLVLRTDKARVPPKSTLVLSVRTERFLHLGKVAIAERLSVLALEVGGVSQLDGLPAGALLVTGIPVEKFPDRDFGLAAAGTLVTLTLSNDGDVAVPVWAFFEAQGEG